MTVSSSMARVMRGRGRWETGTAGDHPTLAIDFSVYTQCAYRRLEPGYVRWSRRSLW
jgi:hypothetical protein